MHDLRLTLVARHRAAARQAVGKGIVRIQTWPTESQRAPASGNPGLSPDGSITWYSCSMPMSIGSCIGVAASQAHAEFRAQARKVRRSLSERQEHRVASAGESGLEGRALVGVRLRGARAAGSL